MSVYFVNCDDLVPTLASRGVAGEWIGNDQVMEFIGAHGATLCWLVKKSMVLTGGENVEELVERLPELVPWEEATDLYQYVALTFTEPVDARTAWDATRVALREATMAKGKKSRKKSSKRGKIVKLVKETAKRESRAAHS